MLGTNWSVEAVREALPGEECTNEYEIGAFDVIPCGEPAAVQYRVTNNGVEVLALVCDQCGDQLRQAAEAQASGGAILP